MQPQSKKALGEQEAPLGSSQAEWLGRYLEVGLVWHTKLIVVRYPSSNAFVSPAKELSSRWGLRKRSERCAPFVIGFAAGVGFLIRSIFSLQGLLVSDNDFER